MKINFLLAQILLFVLVSAPFNSTKADVLVGKQFFKQLGKTSQFQWAPEGYKNNFKFDIFYYIPKSLENADQVNSLVFLHGGGQSTETREGAAAAVKLYLQNFQNLAEDLGFVLVMPSSSGMNWGSQTVDLMKSLNSLMKRDLSLNPNKIGLSGHSMGGMGIARYYNWLTDQYSFILPLSAGIIESDQTEVNLSTLFNVNYTHIQGLYDHFDAFVTRCKEQQKRMTALETKLGIASKFEMVFYNGAHNYDYNLVRKHLIKLFTITRDAYQSKLFATVYAVNKPVTVNNISYTWKSQDEFFWTKILIKDVAKNSGRVDYTAESKQNTIQINLKSKPLTGSSIRLYFSSKMFDLKNPIQVQIGSGAVQTFDSSRFQPATQVSDDQARSYESYIEVPLSADRMRALTLFQ